jgi:hypothetical protein
LDIFPAKKAQDVRWEVVPMSASQLTMIARMTLRYHIPYIPRKQSIEIEPMARSSSGPCTLFLELSAIPLLLSLQVDYQGFGNNA